jgi:SRSO17 transposase
MPARAWQRISAGSGAKGPRWYDWALVEVTEPAVTDGDGRHWLLIRRRISDGEYAFYRAYAPRPVPLSLFVQVAGSRWKVEDGFAADKELAALDEHQVRGWTSCFAGPSWRCSPTRSWPSSPRPSPAAASHAMTS